MEISIKAEVRVYLYTQVTCDGGATEEVIRYAKVYGTREEAEKAIRVGEKTNVQDGEPFETILGTEYQYHVEYKNDRGNNVREIRRERLVEEQNGTICRWEACRYEEFNL